MENSKIEKIVQYIKTSDDKKVTVKNIAHISGYSESYIYRLFMKYYGVSPREYILNYKIKKAEELLMEEPERNMEEIAECLGMYNAAHFCKMFKKKTGYSPREYKKVMESKRTL